ncbi:RES family NAD+ phosphorylase [Burkholderia sp. S171]|uniref:RES family NAD+ phosphorylase n=1 Tax=Burkholderia sp. S171 TaxID=1641860 RepID=UPI00131DE51D|nr:RES family NAD+ phosphorylase [Burkholderia sp. S171]
MRTVWRVVSQRYADTAFSGEGARLYGGRWNPKGCAMVYTAQTQSLALLEMLVQDAPLHASYVMIPVRVPEQIVTHIDQATLPTDWRELSARNELQQIGAAWVRSETSAVLAVPSAVVPAEFNFLLNPAHPDYPLLEIGTRTEWLTDQRLLRRAPGPK